MALTSEKIARKITSGSYKSLTAARAAIKRTKLKTAQRESLFDVADKYFEQQSQPDTDPPEEQEPQFHGAGSAANALLADHGRAYSAKAEPTKILEFEERLTNLAFHFLSVALDFKLTKEELGRRLATKIRSV